MQESVFAIGRWNRNVALAIGNAVRRHVFRNGVDAGGSTTGEPATATVDSAASPLIRAWIEVEGEEGAATAMLGVRTDGSIRPRDALVRGVDALLSDLRSPFDLDEPSSEEARFISRWLPRGRSLTLGHLLEAGLLFAHAPEGPPDVDVSFRVEPGDFLDNPDDERLVLRVTATGGAPPRDRFRVAVATLRAAIDGVGSAEEDGSSLRPAIFASAPAEAPPRRFERVAPAVEMDHPLAIPRDSFDRFLSPGTATSGLGWLLGHALNVDSGLGGKLEKVIITRVEQSTYYAELIVRRNGEVFSLDARPSDSIAVALRVDARIFAQEDLLEIASIEVSEDESAADITFGIPEAVEPEKAMGPEELKEHLRKLNPEDFGRFTP